MFKSLPCGRLLVDSLGRWCGFHNYRAKHFKYATVPLTYAGDPPQPCLWNRSSLAEYLWELGKRLPCAGQGFPRQRRPPQPGDARVCLRCHGRGRRAEL